MIHIMGIKKMNKPAYNRLKYFMYKNLYSYWDIGLDNLFYLERIMMIQDDAR